MKIHEYQAKAILKKYGVAVPRGEMATSREQAETAAKNLFAAGAPALSSKLKFTRAGAVKAAASRLPSLWKRPPNSPEKFWA